MQKNVASQKWVVFAFKRTDNTPTTGDAANITGNLRLDGGAANAIDDTNPTELEDGYYVFDITQAESNADNILIAAESTTADIQVVGAPPALYTVLDAALASVCTEARLAELDAANLPTDVADIPTVAEFDARTIVAASYFDPAVDKVTLDDTAHGGGSATLTLSDYDNFNGSTTANSTHR